MLRSTGAASAARMSRWSTAAATSARWAAASSLPSTSASASATATTSAFHLGRRSLATSSLRRPSPLVSARSPLFTRSYATPTDDKPRKNDDDKKGKDAKGDSELPKDLEEGIEKGLKAAKEGRKVTGKSDDNIPNALKGWFSSGDEGKSSGGSKKNAKDDEKKDGKDSDNKKGGSGGAGAGGPGGPFGGGSSTEIRLNGNTIFAMAITTYLVYQLTSPSSPSREITWQEFRTAFLDKGLVDRLVVVNRTKVKVYLHSNASGAMPPAPGGASPGAGGSGGQAAYWFSVGSVEAFERKLDDAQRELQIPANERIPVAYKEEISTGQTLLHFAPTLLLAGLLFYMTRRAAGGMTGGGGAGGPGGIFGIGKSRAKMFNQETDVKTKFNSVAGMDEAKEEIMEFVNFLKKPERYEKLGAKIPRGAILSGPPGTGKTLLAKATAGEAGVPFLSVSGSEFVEMFVGVGPSRVRDMFANAKKHAPCIIFVDEIDAIGKARGKGGSFGGNDERESTLNELLVQMDGFGTEEHVVVLAGTNRPDVLDPALMRPGRFDRHIAIDRPDVSGRRDIFKVHLKPLTLDKSIDKDILAEKLSVLTSGFSGADISNVTNEAALIAARQGADAVYEHHFEQAIDRVIAGLEKKSRVLSPTEKKTVAYHEAGHAVAGYFLEHVDPLLKVSIVPRGQALGFAQYNPRELYLMSRVALQERIMMTLAGRASEDIFFGDANITSGASDDIQKVSRIAHEMIVSYGMDQELGLVNYKGEQQEFNKPYSEVTGTMIDKAVRSLVADAYAKTKDLLREHKEHVEKLAKVLLEKEVINRDDIRGILGPSPFPAKNAELDKHGALKRAGQTSAPPPPPDDMPEPTLASQKNDAPQ